LHENTFAILEVYDETDNVQLAFGDKNKPSDGYEFE
jgi:hypothetical protein